MTYAVKEIYYTLQGEGGQAGRAAVFCRFAGCNLWTGREEDRAKAICRFCDTEFVGTDGPGGGKFGTAMAVASAVASLWPQGVPGRPLVELNGVCAKIVSELISVGGMESSDAVASEVCGAGKPDPAQLRKRLDKNLWTLRRKLERAHLRPDLVRATGTGFLQLMLQEGDEVIDET